MKRCCAEKLRNFRTRRDVPPKIQEGVEGSSVIDKLESTTKAGVGVLGKLWYKLLDHFMKPRTLAVNDLRNPLMLSLCKPVADDISPSRGRGEERMADKKGRASSQEGDSTNRGPERNMD